MRLLKIRRIVSNKGGFLLGVSLPSKFNQWEGIFVNITESGNALILESGALPIAFDSKQIKRDAEVLAKISL